MKPVVVILEGPDGAGKTTLARQLCKRLDAMYIHHSSYPTLRGDQLTQLYHLSLEPALTGTASVVLDRAWHSEPIYAEVFRSGYDRVEPWRRMLNRCLLSVPHLVVYLTAPFETLWATVGARPAEELAKRRDQLERVVAGYDKAWNRWTGNSMYLTRDELPQLVDQVVENVTSQQEDVCARLRQLGVVGNTARSARKILLVGDSPSPASTTSLPFVNYNLGGCSAWLAAYLEEQNILEDGLMWVNAYNEHGQVAELSEIRDLTDCPVVALGGVAHMALQLYQIPHEHVPHPQHVKRFHADSYELGQTINRLQA